jgi:energy-coupling factor transport system permease protein
MTVLGNLTLGQYLPGTSPVHRIDPRVKLGACLLCMAAAFLPGSRWGVACTWPLLILGVLASGVPTGYFLRGFRPFGWLFLFTVVLHALTTPGRGLLIVPFTSAQVTVEGLTQGASVVAQLATAIAYSSLLTLTTNPTDLVWALERLGSPLARLRVPVSEFGVTTLLALRFFPILHQEADRLLFALRARGIDPGAGRLHERVRNTAPLVVPLFRQVFQRAEALALAMEIRGYRPGLRRTSWRARGLGGLEAAALALSVLTLAAAGWTLWVGAR